MEFLVFEIDQQRILFQRKKNPRKIKRNKEDLRSILCSSEIYLKEEEHWSFMRLFSFVFVSDD